MVKIVKEIAEWKEIKRSLGHSSLGFVPTMGALHKGHVSLMERSVRENDYTLASIFVNPTQFNDPSDLENYPETLTDDIKKLEEAGVDFLFLPNKEMMYPDGYRYIITENSLSRKFCGAHRPGHFDGVLSIVMKLLNIAGAGKCYMGEKDWQQYLLIKGMAEAFFMKTEIVPCPLIREEDGLAYSSRNALLTPDERKKAPLLYQILSSGKELNEMEELLNKEGFKVDYLERFEERILIAAFLGKVRLIDNVQG